MSDANVVQVKAIDRIVKGLAQKPAYLLMFGVCLLVFGIGTATGVGGLIASNNAASWGGLVVAAFAICVTAIMVVKIESIGSHAPVGAVGDRELEPIFAAVHQNVRDALRVQHPVFHDWLKRECANFRADTRQWAHGELQAVGRRYNELLVETYARAETSVFATATEDYFPMWRSSAGRAIVAANRKGKAAVERVFIFESLDRVKDEHILLMKEQADPEGKIKVYVYGVKEHEVYEMPRGMNKNFAFIDAGNVIASTDPSAGDSQKGSFYFKDDNQKFTYEDVIANLRDGVQTLDEFAASRKAPISMQARLSSVGTPKHAPETDAH
jgi:hypothetical protein